MSDDVNKPEKMFLPNSNYQILQDNYNSNDIVEKELDTTQIIRETTKVSSLKQDCVINPACLEFLNDVDIANKFSCNNKLYNQEFLDNEEFDHLNLDEINDTKLKFPQIILDDSKKARINDTILLDTFKTPYLSSVENSILDIATIDFDALKANEDLALHKNEEFFNLERDTWDKSLFFKNSAFQEESNTLVLKNVQILYDPDRDLVLELDEKLCINKIHENTAQEQFLPEEIIDVSIDGDNNKICPQQTLDGNTDFKTSSKIQIKIHPKQLNTTCKDAKIVTNLNVKSNKDDKDLNLNENSIEKNDSSIIKSEIPNDDLYYSMEHTRVIQKRSFIGDSDDLKEETSLKKIKTDEDQLDNEKIFKKNKINKNAPIYGNYKDRIFKCGLFGCYSKFSTKKNLKKHQRCHDFNTFTRHHFYCHYCKQKFSKWAGCSLHLWNDHKEDIDLLLCGICFQYKTNLPSKMATHQLTHSEKLFKCEDCKKMFSQKSQLRGHWCSERPEEEKSYWSQPMFCKICNKNFSSYKSYKLHYVSIHLQIKKYSCQYCNYRCSQKVHLNAHLRIHQRLKPYMCEICGLCVSDHNSIRRHRMTHIPQRTIKCPLKVCSYTTVKAASFKKHIEDHPSRTFNFDCEQCSFMNTDLDEYLLHLNFHNKENFKSLMMKAKHIDKIDHDCSINIISKDCFLQDKNNQDCFTEDKNNQDCFTKDKNNQDCFLQDKNNQNCFTEDKSNQYLMDTDPLDNSEIVNNSIDNKRIFLYKTDISNSVNIVHCVDG